MTGIETEIKLRLSSVEDGQSRLARAGFTETSGREFESNTLFDFASGALRQSRQMVRVRTYGQTSTLTYKGAPIAGLHKSREEIEIEISSAGGAHTLLDRLGLQPTFRYEKYRTEFSTTDGEGKALLDETPIGVFLELEGPAPWIDQAAERLGFSPRDYVRASYGRLWEEWRRSKGSLQSNMVFSPHTPYTKTP